MLKTERNSKSEKKFKKCQILTFIKYWVEKDYFYHHYFFTFRHRWRHSYFFHYRHRWRHSGYYSTMITLIRNSEKDVKSRLKANVKCFWPRKGLNRAGKELWNIRQVKDGSTCLTGTQNRLLSALYLGPGPAMSVRCLAMLTHLARVVRVKKKNLRWFSLEGLW